MPVCERCGTDNPEGFRFCGGCGETLPQIATAARQTRKVVTALFCDVTGSTALGKELDPEPLRGVITAISPRSGPPAPRWDHPVDVATMAAELEAVQADKPEAIPARLHGMRPLDGRSFPAAL
jgi:hypothetical protein